MKSMVLIAVLFAAPASAGDNQYLPPPLLGPPKVNVYGPGINSDATGRPFHYQAGADRVPLDQERVKPNVYGPGIGMDPYGRPVQAIPDDDAASDE
jgi:hypothetical protein